jgi:glycosyltransferase involved in cell wall biosynthesis
MRGGIKQSKCTKQIRKTMDENREKLAVGILTAPLAAAGITPLSNLVDVIYPNTGDIYLITGEEGYDRFKNDKRVRIFEFRKYSSAESHSHLAQRVFRYCKMQIQAASLLAKVGRRVDVWVFFIQADCLPLAGLVSKALGRTLLVMLAGSACDTSAATASFPRVIAILQKANLRFSDRIVLYSDLVKEWKLEPYRKKVVIAGEHFLNFNEFSFKNDLQERAPLVGYFGRLEAEKGVLNLVEALPKTLEERPDVRVLIIGEGSLKDEIRMMLNSEPLRNKVTFESWVPHAEIPSYLAKLKLLVLPSYTEGLPNVMLEAMACGTPVLTTPVGAIPHVIKDKETGFFLHDNSAASIARGIVDTLGYPDLEKIATTARLVVENEYRYESVVKTWAALISKLTKNEAE